MIKKPSAFHPPLDPCPLLAEIGKPAPGPHAKDGLHLLTKLFVCSPDDPELCGWFSSPAVSQQALTCLCLPSS